MAAVGDFIDNVIDNAATVTANATSATFVRPSNLYGGRHKVVLDINIGAAPTGTTPTLTFSLQASLDGTTWYEAANSGALNAQTTVGKRFEATGVEPFWQVVKTVGGTTPSFTQVTSHLLFQAQ